jgi:hypothetical protein
MKILRGNRRQFSVQVTDKNGDVISNLSSATSVQFEIKTGKTAASALVTKTLGGADLSIDTPTTGYITITLSPTDTSQNVTTYSMGLEIQFGASNVQEIPLMEAYKQSETIEIIQDTVN